ncbi:hypothetical protein LTR84_000512 [Exophiala bonariae]|uniref:Uncharacterized protein n=1 Tax=Exophiala bonariae TaxID=1690606 RepID=A0AAV9NR43_9EURO|nr:hypothetical protein LTR84_000512 [Exophiala bonariae]
MSQQPINISDADLRLLLACLAAAVQPALVIDYQRLQANNYPGVEATALHARVSRMARPLGLTIRGDGRERVGVKRKRGGKGKGAKKAGEEKRAVEEEEEDDDDDKREGGDDADPTTTTTTKKPRLDEDEDDVTGGSGAAAAAATATVSATA